MWYKVWVWDPTFFPDPNNDSNFCNICIYTIENIRSDQIRSVAQSCLTLCDHMNRSTPGLPVHHQLPEFTQTHVIWVRDAISSSVFSFSSCLQSFPASGAFPMSWLLASGGQSARASASASALPMNIQGWLPLGLTGWISLQSKGLSRDFLNTTIRKSCSRLK